MKKLMLIASVILLCFCISCGNKGGMSAKAKKNLEASRTISKAFETGDTSLVDKVVAADFIDHTDKGDWPRDSLKAMISMMKDSKDNMKMVTEKEFADDDYTFTWMRFTGTSDGQMGMPAGPYDFREIQVVKFKDGMATEHWAYTEFREMMKMMQSTPMDTTGKKPM